MEPQVAQRIAQFMTRVTLTPPEIPDYNACMGALQQEMLPEQTPKLAQVPSKENEDGRTDNTDPDARAG